MVARDVISIVNVKVSFATMYEYVLFSRSSRFRRKTLETVVIGRQVVKREERSGCCALFLMSFVTEVEGNLYKGSMRFSPRRVANQRVSQESFTRITSRTA